MGSTELAANLFRTTQDKEKANKTHFEVGTKVRKTIKELGGEMPENLRVAEAIGKVERS